MANRNVFLNLLSVAATVAAIMATGCGRSDGAQSTSSNKGTKDSSSISDIDISDTSSGRLTGGGGIDGKLTFVNYSDCSGPGSVNNGTLQPSNIISVSEVDNVALLVRENCQDLPMPRPLNTAGVHFVSQDQTTLIWGHQAFDVQTGSPVSQRVTLRYCRIPNDPKLVRVAIWQYLGAPSEIHGSVTALSGKTLQSTGDLVVTQTRRGTVNYSGAGEGGQFTLSIAPSSNGTGGTLSYKIGTAPSTSANVLCTDAQSRLPAP